MPTPLLVLVTTADEDSATALARQLVSERLIGCANLLPVRRSIYLWEGKVCEDPEVLMVMDEFATLGKIPTILNALASYRSAGLRGWPLVQTIGQFEEIYGESGVKNFMGQCSLKMFFQVQDQAGGEDVSKMLGRQTVIDRSSSENAQNAAVRGENLLQADEVRKLADDEMIVIYRNLDPAKVKLAPYYADERMRQLVDDSVAALRDESPSVDVEQLIEDERRKLLEEDASP